MAALSFGRGDALEAEPLSQGCAASAPADAAHPPEGRLDYFIRENGTSFAGTHVIVDLWSAARLDDPAHIEASLVAAAREAGATVLSSDFHVFTPNNGVSGVVVLSESHISIHTWPEAGFAAVDVFMCGAARPEDTVPFLRAAFAAERADVQIIKRGRGVAEQAMTASVSASAALRPQPAFA